MKKVLQISRLYAPKIGGVELVVQQIAEGLKDSVDMQVLVCQEKGKSSDESYHGVSLHRSSSLGVALSMPISLSFISDVRKYAKSADIIHLHMPFPLADLALLLSGYKGKIIIWWHMDIVRQKRAMALYRPLRNWMLKRADKIIVATQGHVDGNETLKLYQNKIVAIPFGVEDSLLEDGKNHLATYVRPDGPTQFLFIGRLVYYKGCDVLLKAFATMQNKEAILHMVGDGPLKDELTAMAKTLGVSSRVHFHGRVTDEDLREQIRLCDVFVLPSSERTEAFGIVQIEAMAYGKPVINTNLPTGVPHVSLDGLTGLTVPPKDESALSAALDELATNHDKRKEFSINARKRVEDNFRLTTMLESVREVYNTV